MTERLKKLSRNISPNSLTGYSKYYSNKALMPTWRQKIESIPVFSILMPLG